MSLPEDAGSWSAPEPNNIQAEQSVLGSMMMSAGVIGDVSAIVTSADYYRPHHQIAHEIITGLHAQGRPVDPVSVADELRRRGQLKPGALDGPYLHTLIEAGLPPSAVHHARIVHSCADRRDLLAHAERLRRAAADPGTDPAEVRPRAIDALAEWLPDGRRASGPDARPFRMADLASLVRDGVPPPELLCGDLLYVGGLHSISGPPDSGKTTIALWWLLQEARAGRPVMFLDEEGGAELVAEKLIALGATEQDAALISYYPFPARTWTPADMMTLRGVLDDVKPAVALWDSAAAFLSRAGLDENSAADVTRFWAQVLTPIAREHGAAVVVIDHDTKDTATSSRYARGSGAKLAACDVAYKIEIVQPFSRGTNGVMRLRVSKDRRGWLHRSWEVGISTSEGMQVKIVETEDDDDGRAVEQPLTKADLKVQAALTARAASIADITDRIVAQNGHGLTRPTVSASLNKLLRRGAADKLDQGAGRPALWSVFAGQTCQPTGRADQPSNLSAAS